MSLSVGLIGARGYTGRELVTILAKHSAAEIVFASSREWDGRTAQSVIPEAPADLTFEALGPDDAAARKPDVAFLGLPNGKASPYVEAFDRLSPDTLLIDLSADFRADPSWVYGLPELAAAKRSEIKGAKRIANPGCYATAAQLSVAPLIPYTSGPVTVFGLSGYSGAGTTPSRRNDPAALADNAMPYAQTGHNHEPEIARGLGAQVRFMPTVASFFRGLVTVSSAAVRPGTNLRTLQAALSAAYGNETFVRLLTEEAEPKAAAHTHACHIGAPATDGERVVITGALDNLLKGAASQAVQNMNLALGLPEADGLHS